MSKPLCLIANNENKPVSKSIRLYGSIIEMSSILHFSEFMYHWLIYITLIHFVIKLSELNDNFLAYKT